MLESSLIQILLAAEFADRISFPKKGDIFLSKKTLGQLIIELKRAGMDEDTEQLLGDALNARNFLMHNFFVCRAGDYRTEDGRGNMLKELQNLRFRIGRAQQAFSQVRQKAYEKFFGITSDELKRRYDDYLKKQPATRIKV